jgi:hypothetical protein
MKMGRIVIIPLIFFLISCSSQIVHVMSGEEVKPGPASMDEMTNRIVEIISGKPRFNLFDLNGIKIFS